MSDTTSLIIAVVSLIGTGLIAVITGAVTHFNEESKARKEADKILLKYRDPLLLAAQDLQARLYGLCDMTILDDFMAADGPGEETYKDALYIYTAYVVGQYLSWIWIIRRQGQFVALISSASTWSWSIPRLTKKNVSSTTLIQKIDNIKTEFHIDTHGHIERPFILFKAHQTGIGEIMSCRESDIGEYYCMGFATFTQRWKKGGSYTQGSEPVHEKVAENMAGVASIPDSDFRAAFNSIEKGVNEIWRHRQNYRMENPDKVWNKHSDGRLWNKGSDGRLRRLQHLLLDLTKELDPRGLLNNQHENSRVRGLLGCQCTRKDQPHAANHSPGAVRTVSGSPVEHQRPPLTERPYINGESLA